MNTQKIHQQVQAECFSLNIEHNKEDKYLYVSLWILKLEALKPNLKWKITELAKHSKISRSWIYKYFSSNQKKSLEQALTICLEEFYGESGQRQFLQKKYGLVSGVFRSRAIFLAFPEVLLFYYKYRSNKGHTGQLIQQAESDLFKRLSKSTGLKGDALNELYAGLHGTATLFFLTEEQVYACATRIIKKVLS